MTSINSANAIQSNSAASATSTVAGNSPQEQSSSAAAFAQQLATANSTLNSSAVASSVNQVVDTANAIKPAMDIDLGFTSNAIASSGLNPSEFLSQSLKSAMQSQFNTLGQEIAASFMAGIAGQDSATATESSEAIAEDSAADTLLAAADTSDIDTSGEQSSATTAPTDNSVLADDAQQQVTETQQSTGSADIFPEFIHNLFADLSFLKGKDNNDSEGEEDTNNTAAEQDSDPTLETSELNSEPVVG